MTEENLKNMRNEYDSLKDSLLRDRANFRSELRLKDNISGQEYLKILENNITEEEKNVIKKIIIMEILLKKQQ